MRHERRIIGSLTLGQRQMTSRLGAAVILGPILVLSWIAMIPLSPQGSGISSYVAIGYLLGTIFGQTTLAAAWAAFGPGRWAVRLFAPLWVLILLACFALSVSMHGEGGWFMLLLAGCLLGQWILVLLPFAGFSLTYALQLEHRSSESDAAIAGREPRQLQFGIRQLLILTSVVAVILAAMRSLVLYLVARSTDRNVGEASIFIFLAVAAVVMTVPLVMALLLPRWWIASTVGVLALIAIATMWEFPLLSLLPRTAGPDTWHFAFINGVTAGWIVLVVGALRLCGFRLAPTNFGLTLAKAKSAHLVASA